MTLGNSSSFEVQAPCDQAAARPVVRRVFHLIDSFNVGGTETQAVELARRLPATGYEVTVGCLKREGPLEDRLQGTGIAIREFRSRGGIDSPSGLRQLLRMSWFLRSFDIVHTHDLWSNLVGVPAARLAGIPAIVSSRREPFIRTAMTFCVWCSKKRTHGSSRTSQSELSILSEMPCELLPTHPQCCF